MQTYLNLASFCQSPPPPVPPPKLGFQSLFKYPSRVPALFSSGDGSPRRFFELIPNGTGSLRNRKNNTRCRHTTAPPADETITGIETGIGAVRPGETARVTDLSGNGTRTIAALVKATGIVRETETVTNRITNEVEIEAAAMNLMLRPRRAVTGMPTAIGLKRENHQGCPHRHYEQQQHMYADKSAPRPPSLAPGIPRPHYRALAGSRCA